MMKWILMNDQERVAEGKFFFVLTLFIVSTTNILFASPFFQIMIQMRKKRMMVV